jgi:hypothetical protein
VKPARDIEVGDRITRTGRHNEVESIFTVAEVLSRRGKVRRVRDAHGQEVALYVHDDGSVRGHQLGAWSSISYRREEPDDVEALQRVRDVNRLQRLAHGAMFASWPIEDVRRVLAAWPGEKR